MIPVQVVPRTLDGVRDVDGVQRVWVAAEGVPCKSPTSCPPLTRRMCRWNGMHVPEWMANAAGACKTCDGLGNLPIFDPVDFDTEPCSDCLNGKPLVDLRVECPNARCLNGHHCVLGRNGEPESVGPCRDCVDGTVSAGVWRVVDGPAPIAADEIFAIRHSLAHLYDRDPSVLVGQWAVELERVR